MDKYSKDLQLALFYARPNPCNCALENGAKEKSSSKADKYKAKYDKCKAKRKAKGKPVWPQEPGKSFLGITSDCRNKYKKWKKWEPVAHPETIEGEKKAKKTQQELEEEALSDVMSEMEGEDSGLSMGMAVGILGLIAVVGIGGIFLLSRGGEEVEDELPPDELPPDKLPPDELPA